MPTAHQEWRALHIFARLVVPLPARTSAGQCWDREGDMGRIEGFICGAVLLAMTLVIVLCALVISPLLWVPVATLAWANLTYWGLT